MFCVHLSGQNVKNPYTPPLTSLYAAEKDQNSYVILAECPLVAANPLGLEDCTWPWVRTSLPQLFVFNLRHAQLLMLAVKLRAYTEQVLVSLLLSLQDRLDVSSEPLIVHLCCLQLRVLPVELQVDTEQALLY